MKRQISHTPKLQHHMTTRIFNLIGNKAFSIEICGEVLISGHDSNRAIEFQVPL